MSHAQLKCIFALKACSDESMLRELLRDYMDLWTIDTLIEKVRMLEKCTSIAQDFSPNSVNAVEFGCGRNTCGRARG